MSSGFDQAVRSRADDAGVVLTDSHVARLGAYYELLLRWTRTINLTSLPLEGYPPQTIERLIVEPLLAARFFPVGSPLWLDFGTGSGSPAVPLRVVQPAGSLDMIESRERKTAFLREVVRVVGLERTEVRTTRIEEFSASAGPALADLITMRAVKPTFPILRAAAHLLRAGGRFLLFGSADNPVKSGGAGVEELGLEATETAALQDPGHQIQVLTRC